jgi:hypothetical protein
LRGAGGTLLTLPYLDYFAPRARAQAVSPKRLVIFQHPQGMVMDRWTPSGTGTGYTISEILEPMEAHRDKTLILSGIDNLVRLQMQRGNAHNPAARSLLTCFPYAGSMNENGTVKAAGEQVENGPAFGPSVDHVIATRQEVRTRFTRLDYKVNGMGVGENQIFWAEDQVPIEAQSDPVAAFDSLMSEIGPVVTTEPSYADRMRAHRGSVLDSVLDSFNRLAGRVGAEDRARLEAHAAMIRGLESSIDIPISEGCMPPASGPAMPAGYAVNNRDFDNAAAPALIDNMVLALSCDLTRVATLQFADGHAPTFGWLGADVPGSWENWHDMIHSGQSDDASRATMVQCMRWYTEQFAYLLSRMDAVIEADGNTLLDNSLVLWVSEFGNGGAHNTRTLPVVIGGSLGGAITTGRHLAMTGRTTGDLYSTLLNLFGYDDQEFGLTESITNVTLNNGPFELG